VQHFSKFYLLLDPQDTSRIRQGEFSGHKEDEDPCNISRLRMREILSVLIADRLSLVKSSVR
jgi:hypothetical protein